MIQFNKTIFQFTKRFALVVFCLLFSAVTWAGGKSYNSKLTVKTNGTASGLVYISKEKEAGTISDDQWKESEYTEEQSGPDTWNGSNTHTYYIYAKSPANSNYRWGGWYDSETAANPIQNTIALEGNHKHEVQIVTEKRRDYDYEDANGNGQYDQGEEYYRVKAYEERTYVAKWLLPSITQTYIESIKDEQIKNIKTITNTDPNQNVTFETIVFNTVDASSLDDFKPLEVPEGFIKNSATVTTQDDLNNLQLSPKEYAILYSNSQCFVKVAIPITPIQDLTGKLYTFKLTSNYYESNKEPSSGIAEIIVKQDYTPKFGYNTSTVLWIRGSEEKNIQMQWLNEVAKHTQTYWKTTLTGDGAFQISSGSNTYSPVIKYIEPEGISENPTATLIITCYYNNNTENTNDDIQSEIIPAENGDVLVDEQGNKIRQLTITLEADPKDQIVFQPTEWDFGTIICGELVEKEDIAVFHNLTSNPTLASAETNNEAFTFSASDWNNKNAVVTATVNSSLLTPSNTQYIATYTATGQNDVSATFTVKVTVDLGTPKLSGSPGNQLVELTWATISGADKYEIKWSGNEQNGTIDIGDPTKTSYQHIGLTNDIPYTYTLKAICNDIEKESNTITITPKYYPNFIAKVYTVYDDGSVAVAANKTGLYTGSSDNEQTHEIDVSAAFAGENVQFEWLYLFGEGVGEKSPCYIYRKNSDSRYAFVVQVEMTESAKNGTYFNVNTDMKSLYLTGYCEKATTGTKWNENGVLQIKKGSIDNINLFLDGLEILAKDKGQTKLTIKDQEELNNYWGRSFAMEGSGDILVFDMTDGLYTPYIHIRGENYLKSTNSLNLELAGKAKVNDKTELPLYINYEQNPSVIKIMVNNEDQKADLNITDAWHDLENQQNIIRTNGNLSLNSIDDNKPLINLGYKNSKLIINGGQVYFNNKNEGVATAYNYAKRKDKIDEDNQPETYMYGCSSATPGTGNTSLVSNDFTSDAECAVQFKDGTISAATSPLLCPTNTTIDGGSFNCDITIGNDANGNPLPIYSSGDTQKAHKLHKISANIIESVGIIENGLAVFKTGQSTDDKDGFDVLMDNIFPLANCQLTIEEQNYYTSLSYYYPEVTDYGHSSLAPQGTTVYLMLPKDGSVSGTNYKGWSFCAPHMQGTADIGGKTFVTDDVEIISTAKDKVLVSEANDKLKVTNRLLFIELDAISESVLNESSSITIKDAPYEVTNSDVYTINEKTYMLLPVVAGQWRMVVPPFDVHNVYVIESYPEEQLKKDFGEEVRAGRWRIEGKEAVTNARKAQSNRLLDLLAYWLAVENLDTDFFGASTGTYSFFVNNWINYEQKRDKDGKSPDSDANYTPMVEQLFHYTGDDGAYPDGKGWWNANYYLYKSNGVWTGYDSVTNMFETDWEIVTTQSTERGSGTPNVIMNRGGLYTMQFPAVVGTTAVDWNYWTGKYILLEGYGPQTIYGSDDAKAIGASASNPGQDALVFGNASFANIQKEDSCLFYIVEKTNGEYNTVYDFKRAKDENGKNIPVTIKPTEGFLFTDLDATTSTVNEEGQTVQTMKLARTISSETGEVTYEIKTKIIDNDPGLGSGVPTIMNGMSMIVEPTAEGLTITPLKEQHVMLFDAEGKMIFSKYMSEEENVSLPTGVYVVRGEYEQVKAIKK